jgi:heat shock protein HslJ
MKKTVIGVIGLVMVITLVVWFSGPKDTPTPQNIDIVIKKEPIVATFISPTTGEATVVSFSEEVASVNFNEFVDVPLTLVTSASGARYENTDLGLVVWNKGDEVTIYQNDEIIFMGQDEKATGNPNTGEVVTGDVLPLDIRWVWKETTMSDGSVITPNQPEAFTLTFNTDYSVNGTTDCNGFGGDYLLQDGVLTFGPFAMTKMYCEGSQEIDFQQMLQGPLTFMVTEAQELVIMLPYDSGSMIFEM